MLPRQNQHLSLLNDVFTQAWAGLLSDGFHTKVRGGGCGSLARGSGQFTDSVSAQPVASLLSGDFNMKVLLQYCCNVAAILLQYCCNTAACTRSYRNQTQGTMAEEPRRRHLGELQEPNIRNQGQVTSGKSGGRATGTKHEEPKPKEPRGRQVGQLQEPSTRIQGQGTSGKAGGPATGTNCLGK